MKASSLTYILLSPKSFSPSCLHHWFWLCCFLPWFVMVSASSNIISQREENRCNVSSDLIPVPYPEQKCKKKLIGGFFFFSSVQINPSWPKTMSRYHSLQCTFITIVYLSLSLSVCWFQKGQIQEAMHSQHKYVESDRAGKPKLSP